MDAFLIIDKPSDMTSTDVVRVVKRSLSVKKVGYIGTLDPIATGVLPVGVGKATRLFSFLDRQEKTYEAVMTLGASTDTQDRTGKTIAEADPSSVTEEMVKNELLKLKGEIQQIPPMFSAKKIDGKRLYELARQGLEVERKPITAKIRSMEFLGMEGADVRFRVTVSTGAYVRTLCHDVGETLGVHAHMKDLVRTVSGSYTLEQCVPLADLEEGGMEKANEVALSLSEGLSVFPKVVVIAHAADRLKNGIPIGVSDIITYEEGDRNEYIRVVDKTDRLLAVGETEGAPVAGFPFMTIKPKKVFV